MHSGEPFGLPPLPDEIKEQEGKNDMATMNELKGLEKLRAPFKPNQISKLPKPTKRQTDEVRADFKKGIRCEICGGWHHPNVVHLDYVGHAALTDRLLDCDTGWNWEPVATDENGLPKFDAIGGLWIKLTVCGETRLGYGCADGKKGGDAIKEVIGDALRNSAMRFGAALDLWHKGELHVEDAERPEEIATVTPEQFVALRNKIEETGAKAADFLTYFNAASLEQFPADKFRAAMDMLAKKAKQAEHKPEPDHGPEDDLGGDGIQY